MEKEYDIDPLLDTGDAGRRFGEDLKRMWVWASRPDVSTSQRMESVSPEDAAKYRELKKQGKSHDEIMAMLKQIHMQLIAEQKRKDEREDWIKRGLLMIFKGIGWIK